MDYVDKTTAFNKLWFPEKETIINLLKKLDAEQIPKLSLLLHGPPGCGKSTLSRVISESTGRSIVVIKLSAIKSDEELMDAFFNPKIYTDDGYKLIQNSKRVYLLEDIDAESDIIFQREELEKKKLDESKGKQLLDKIKPKEEMDVLNEEETENKTVRKLYENSKSQKSELDKEIDAFEKMEMAYRKFYKKDKFTLAGFLNALDGILKLTGAIIIMTTNHPEKIDDAVKRYGRVNMQLEMKKMLKSDAMSMIKYHFSNELHHRNTALLNKIIKDYSIAPSHLEALCQSCPNIDILIGEISKIQEAF